MVRREVFIVAKGNPPHQLRLVDAVQRLGLSYHFEIEIDEALQHIYHTYHGCDEERLYDAALRFRLLRQHGYNVSCGESLIYIKRTYVVYFTNMKYIYTYML